MQSTQNVSTERVASRMLKTITSLWDTAAVARPGYGLRRTVGTVEGRRHRRRVAAGTLRVLASAAVRDGSATTARRPVASGGRVAAWARSSQCASVANPTYQRRAGSQWCDGRGVGADQDYIPPSTPCYWVDSRLTQPRCGRPCRSFALQLRMRGTSSS